MPPLARPQAGTVSSGSTGTSLPTVLVENGELQSHMKRDLVTGAARPSHGSPRSRTEDAPSETNGDRHLRSLLTVIAVGTILYLARPILVPCTLALLTAAALEPAGGALRRLRVPPLASVLLPVLLTLVLFAAAVTVVGVQLPALMQRMPSFESNIRDRIQELQAVTRVKTLLRMQEMVSGGDATATRDAAPTVVPPGTGTIPWLIEFGTTAAIVVALAMFVLLRQQELRERVIRLFGYANLPVTRRALEEASTLISRYLYGACLINASVGAIVFVCLWLLRVPFAPLWGLLAAALRFIPYFGAWIAASLPILVSLAVAPGWLQPMLVALLFLLIETLTGFVVEPRLLGSRVGVSDVGVLFAVVFWTWIWGPVGLLIATPLTACLVMLGKYVPSLGVLHVMLGRAPHPSRQQLLYERLRAGDAEDAARLMQETEPGATCEKALAELLLPSLLQAREDLDGGRLTSGEARTFVNCAITAIDTMVPRGRAPERARIWVLAARDGFDLAAAAMLRAVAPPGLALDLLPPELVAVRIRRDAPPPAAACIVALPPDALASVKRLRARLQGRMPGVPVFLSLWGSLPADADAELLEMAVDRTLEASRVRLDRLERPAA